MKVTVTNKTLQGLSTEVGLIPPGATVSQSGIAPDKAFGMAQALKGMSDQGRIKVVVEMESDRLDALESMTSGDPLAATTQYTDVLVTSAQVLALNATPKTLVAAPGAGKALLLEGAVIYMPYNSVAYSGVAAGEDLTIKYTGSGGTVLGTCETTGFIDQTTNQTRYVRRTAAADAAVSDFTPANTPLVLHLLVGEVAAGNSPLIVRVYYKVIPTVLALP